jgi:hypothetical protein
MNSNTNRLALKCLVGSMDEFSSSSIGMSKSRRNQRKTRQTRRRAIRGGSLLSALNPAPLVPAQPGGLSSSLPTTGWGRWEQFPETYAWGPNAAAPAALANGGLYTNPQSTQPWASSPFPATQHAFALEGAKVSGLPEVAYHQRPNDNYGASYSPVVSSPISSVHTSHSGPAGPMSGGRRSRASRSSRNRNRSNRNRRNRSRANRR